MIIDIKAANLKHNLKHMEELAREMGLPFVVFFDKGIHNPFRFWWYTDIYDAPHNDNFTSHDK